MYERAGAEVADGRKSHPGRYWSSFADDHGLEMQDFLVNLTDALPTIAGALLAAFAALLGLIIAKESKTSEFRQAWIDALRQDIAEYISAVRVVAQDFRVFAAHSHSQEDAIRFQLETMSLRQTSSSALARIRLRVNPEDKDAKLRRLNIDFLAQTKLIQDHLARDEFHESLVVSNRLHEYAAPILKREWERVKRGEFRYRLAVWLSGTFLAALLALLIFGFLYAPGSGLTPVL